MFFHALFVMSLMTVISAESLQWFSCTPVCACANDSNGLMRARCDVEKLPHVGLSRLPVDLYSLSIQNNSNIQRIPRTAFEGLESLRELNLRNNSIQNIDRGTFRSLTHLRTLDLQDNDINSWHVLSSMVLPALESILMSGNRHWVPDEDLLRLRSLHKIQGVTWSSHCVDCTLLKLRGSKETSDFNTTNSTDVLIGNMHDSCDVTLDTFYPHYTEVTYGNAYEFVKLGFSPQCLCVSRECQDTEITHLYFKQLNDTPKRLFYTQYALGVVILAINLMTVVVILSSKALRGNASFVLICSMAMSDVLVGVYTIGIAVFNPFTAVTVTPNKMMDNDISVCPYLGFVFTTGQTTTVFTSLLLTVERYLAIIRCIKPRPKLKLKYSLGLSGIIWALAILYALLPILGVKQLQYHKWFQCTMPFHQSAEIDDTSTITLVIVIGFVIVYVASVALYLYIYCFFCKSTAHLAIRREARLAKRLSLVVCTNLVFFVAPTVLFLVYVYRFMDVLFDVSKTFSSLQGFIILGSWVPVTLLGINSLVTPFLYAFKHQKFRREINRICRRLDKYFGEAAVITQEELNKYQVRENNPNQAQADQHAMMLRKNDKDSSQDKS